MNNSDARQQKRDSRRVLSPFPLLIIFFSLIAIVATFLLANSSVELAEKTPGFSGIIAGFLILSAALQLWQSKRRPRTRVTDIDPDDEIERKLCALDEANEFFAGSLKSADTFRLVVNRVKDLLPFQTIVMYLLDETRTQLRIAEADGVDAADQKGKTIGFDEGLAGQCFVKRCVEIDGYLGLDEAQAFGSSAAIPLRHGTEVFGVLQFYFDADFAVESVDQSLFEAVSTRVAPVMLTSISFERSQQNALTDVTTDLPNERAFYLVLENQIAEAQRKRAERPLTILAIDIKNFDDINQKFGHASGDRVLNFVAQVVKDNLRQMDFLARSIGDEFLAVMPTASKEVSHEIIARIYTGFLGRKLKINDEQSIEIELNIGWASFGADGETPGQLLSYAQLRKEQSKSSHPHKVLWFPQEQELVN